MHPQTPEFKNDHDAIVTLVAEVRQIRTDIRDLRDGMSDTVKDHELRINALENKIERADVYVKLLIGLGVLIVSLLIWHLTGYKL